MTNLRERERGRLGGGEEWGISKQEVTELRGTGGQFSSTQRGQSRGHWPFPPFLSLCPPPHHSIMLTLFVFHFAADLKLPLSSSGHISSRAPPCFFPTRVPSFLHSDLLVYFSPTLSSFPFFLVLTHMTCLSFPTALFSSSYLPLSLPRLPCVSPLDCHVRCCCAVDKTQSLSHPSCTWDLWLLLCRRREHVRKTVGGRQTRKEAKRRKKM